MKTEKIKVGAKFGTEKFQVECNVQIPESVEEQMKLSRGDKEFQNQMFVRGWRIWNQENSGARDHIATSTVDQRKQAGFAAEVQGIIDKADPTAPAQRTGRPRKPAEVTITPEQMKAAAKDPAKFAALLAEQGIKVNLAKAAE